MKKLLCLLLMAFTLGLFLPQMEASAAPAASASTKHLTAKKKKKHPRKKHRRKKKKHVAGMPIQTGTAAA